MANSYARHGKTKDFEWKDCKVCASKARDAIEKELLNQKSIRSVAIDYGLTEYMVSRHHKEHLLPFLQDVQAETRLQVANQLADLAEEVYLPLMEKVKMGQSLALQTFKQALASANSNKSYNNAIRALTEFRGWVHQEARMTGEYQKERKNVHDLRTASLKRAIQQRADEVGHSYLDELRYYLNSEFSHEILPEVRRDLLAELAEKEQELRIAVDRGKVIDMDLEALGNHTDTSPPDAKTDKNLEGSSVTEEVTKSQGEEE